MGFIKQTITAAVLIACVGASGWGLSHVVQYAWARSAEELLGSTGEELSDPDADAALNERLNRRLLHEDLSAAAPAEQRAVAEEWSQALSQGRWRPPAELEPTPPRRFQENVLVVGETWALARVDEFASLPVDEQGRFLDRQIDEVLHWAAVYGGSQETGPRIFSSRQEARTRWAGRNLRGGQRESDDPAANYDLLKAIDVSRLQEHLMRRFYEADAQQQQRLLGAFLALEGRLRQRGLLNRRD